MRDKLPARMDRHSSLFVAVQHPVFITIDADAPTASGRRARQRDASVRTVVGRAQCLRADRSLTGAIGPEPSEARIQIPSRPARCDAFRHEIAVSASARAASSDARESASADGLRPRVTCWPTIGLRFESKARTNASTATRVPSPAGPAGMPSGFGPNRKLWLKVVAWRLRVRA